MLFTDGLIEGRDRPPARTRLDEDGVPPTSPASTTICPFSDAFVGHSSSTPRPQSLAADSGGLADDVAVLHLEWNAPS